MLFFFLKKIQKARKVDDVKFKDDNWEDDLVSEEEASKYLLNQLLFKVLKYT